MLPAVLIRSSLMHRQHTIIDSEARREHVPFLLITLVKKTAKATRSNATRASERGQWQPLGRQPPAPGPPRDRELSSSSRDRVLNGEVMVGGRPVPSALPEEEKVFPCAAHADPNPLTTPDGIPTHSPPRCRRCPPPHAPFLHAPFAERPAFPLPPARRPAIPSLSGRPTPSHSADAAVLIEEFELRIEEGFVHSLVQFASQIRFGTPQPDPADAASAIFSQKSPSSARNAIPVSTRRRSNSDGGESSRASTREAAGQLPGSPNQGGAANWCAPSRLESILESRLESRLESTRELPSPSRSCCILRKHPDHVAS